MYIQSLNWFRGIAIIFVVLTHVDSSYLVNMDYALRTFSNGTFLFVFISGYLFWHLVKKYEVKKYYTAKIRNVITPYLFVMTLAVIIFAVAGKTDIDFNNIISQYIVGGGLIGPLWFVPMITLVFITTPVIVFVGDNKLLFLFLLIFSLIISVTSFRPDKYIYPAYMFMHFIGVFLLGILFKKKEDFIKEKSLSLILISAPLFLFFLHQDVLQKQEGLPYFWPLIDAEIDFNYAQIQKIFLTSLIIGLLFTLEYRFKLKEIKVLDLLAKYSFGIFFYHGFITLLLSLINKLDVINYRGLGFFAYLIDFTISIVLSILVCWVLMRLLGDKSKYLTGVSG